MRSVMLDKKFYMGEDVVQIARELLGKVLYTRVDGWTTAGRIVETEAYKGSVDRASHAYPNRKTGRNWIMFEQGGRAYVYLIYGIYYLFNVVTNLEGHPDAVLVRALEPVEGMDVMLKRRGKNSIDRITSGPGILSQAMGIDLGIYGEDLRGEKIWIARDADNKKAGKIMRSRRIGVDYAGEDANLPWRFYLENNPWVSKM